MPAPALGTTVTATVSTDCTALDGSGTSVSQVTLAATGASGTTSPFVAQVDTRCALSVQSYRVELTNAAGTFATEFPWPDSTDRDRC